MPDKQEVLLVRVPCANQFVRFTMGAPLVDKNIRTATWDDEHTIGALMALAFANDPFVRWILPSPQDFIRNSTSHAVLSSGPAFDAGTAFIIGQSAGAVIWLPPGTKLNRDHETGTEEQKDTQSFPDEFAELIEKSAAYCPTEPHWYLSFIVVDPVYRGQGFGTALMEYSLEMCDRDGLPAYLESTNAANISLYKRFGFEVLAEVTVRDSPARYPMLRPPRK